MRACGGSWGAGGGFAAPFLSTTEAPQGPEPPGPKGTEEGRGAEAGPRGDSKHRAKQARAAGPEQRAPAIQGTEQRRAASVARR